MLAFKALHSLAPLFLSELLTPYIPKRDFRYSDSGLLIVSPSRLQSMGDRAFPSFAPKLWNSLPSEVRHAESLSIFLLSLKTPFYSFFVIM